MASKLTTEFSERLRDISHLSSVLAVLGWDQEVHMPLKGGDMRAQTIGLMTRMLHEKVLALDEGRHLTKAKKEAAHNPNTKHAAIIREVSRKYTRERKLPSSFVVELSEHSSKSQQAWIEARRTKSFQAFRPYLEKMIKLKQREAEYIGYRESPYDALLDAYEPDLTSRDVTRIFDELRDALQDLVRKISASSSARHAPSVKRFLGIFPLHDQQTFNAMIARTMGFDFEAGRMDISTHPFTTQFHPLDVRITTRYSERDVLYAIGSTIHEVGHALYEQGLPYEHVGTPLAEAISLGIHESQSRVWENTIGKSRAFWKFFYPKLQRAFPKPYRGIPFDIFYRHLNRVQPSFIRTEADEVTYNLHIIVRFEIERDLIEGRLKVRDVPRVWNAKMKKYFGINVPNDALGVLQDVHWSMGAIGYFPTYTLGNLYAAQFYHTALKELPTLEKDFAHGKFSPIREWLRKKIHVHGKFYSAEALIKEVTGETLQSKYFIEYLQEKYGELYRI